MDYRQNFAANIEKMRKSTSGKFKDKEEIVAMIRKKKDGKHKIKDGNTSLIVRSLARIMMNKRQKRISKKGVAFE